MKNQTIDFPAVVKKFDEALSRGLCEGLGDQDGQMCVEAAVCYAMGEPHGDDPKCVEPSVASFKIRLNDSTGWEDEFSRAAGLRRVGIAQLGSKGVVKEAKFAELLLVHCVRRLIPAVVKAAFPHDKAWIARIAKITTRKQALTELRLLHSGAEAVYQCADLIFDSPDTQVGIADPLLKAATQLDEAVSEFEKRRKKLHVQQTDAIASVLDEDEITQALLVSASPGRGVVSFIARFCERNGDDAMLATIADIAADVLLELKSPGAIWFEKHGKNSKAKRSSRNVQKRTPVKKN